MNRLFSRLHNFGDRLTGGGLRSLAKKLVRISLSRATDQRSEEMKAMTRAANAGTKTDQVKARITMPVGSSGLRLLYISGEPETPGNLYRVARYVEAANAAGAHASWIRLNQVPEHSQEIAHCNLLVIWRAGWDEHIAQAIETAHRVGAAVVYDIDDLLVDLEVVRTHFIDGIRTSGLTELQWQEQCARFRTTMAAADFCTAPTEELAANLRRFADSVIVLPNGFDRMSFHVSRHAVRHRRLEKPDGLLRIGYAGGSRSHQRDFVVAADAVARVLRNRPHCRLVLFQFRFGEDCTVPALITEEFPSFRGIEHQIEWQDIVPPAELPERIARFDINLAPLEVGNPFCEAKSELKFFEAALVDVPTIASPAGPFRRAIRDGETGFLAKNPDDWYAALLRLVDDSALRRSVARAAHNDVLWRYGPLRRADAMLSAIPRLRGDRQGAARAFALELHRGQLSNPQVIRVPETDILFEADQLRDAAVTIVVPMHNCSRHIDETLDSVRDQSLELLDLVVVDDASVDTSVSVALNWAQRYTNRFNRLVILRNRENAGPGCTKNAGVDAAETPFVLSLDAHDRLLPECTAACLSAIGNSSAAFAYPRVRQVGDALEAVEEFSLQLEGLISRKLIGLTLLVLKEAWSAVGGYGDSPSEWQNIDFACRLVELGLSGCPVGEGPLASYSTHGDPTPASSADGDNRTDLIVGELEKRHLWLNTADGSPLTGRQIQIGKDVSALRTTDT
jgi:glycosyltransferase involved in cell wall biosynthesis